MFCNILFTDEVHFNDNEFNTTMNSNILDHDNPCGTVKSEYQYCFFQQCVMWHNWWITGPYIFPQSLIGDIYAKLLQHILPAIPLQEGSTVNMTSDVLPAWCTVHSFQSDCRAISESAPSRSWCWAESATMVNVRDSVWLTCMGIHKHHDVCTATFQWCKTHEVHFTASYG